MKPGPKPHEIIIESVDGDLVVRCTCSALLYESHPTDELTARVSLMGLTQMVQTHYIGQVQN
jgi:hypothetical protein